MSETLRDRARSTAMAYAMSYQNAPFPLDVNTLSDMVFNATLAAVEAEARKILTAKTVGGKPVGGSKVFIGDMTDIAGDWITDALIVRLWATFALRPDVTFQVLTKRPARLRDLISYYRPSGPPPFSQRVLSTASEIAGRAIEELPWPLPNVWLGTSVENQHWADTRIPELLQAPATVRFLSIEPLLADLDLSPWLGNVVGFEASMAPGRPLGIDAYTVKPGIRWGILGGESGNNLRDPGLPAFERVARQFQQAGVPLFVKQDVHRRPGQQGRFPADLWAMKQFPAVASAQPTEG